MQKTEYYKQLFLVFSQLNTLSPPLQNAILENSKIAHVGRRQKLLNEEEMSDSIYFIAKGAVRIFHLSKDGQETNTWFLFENELAISVYSFFTGQPSFEYMETLEDCTFIILKKQRLEWLYQNFIEFNITGRKLTEMYYIRNETQANALRMFSARERYQRLIKTQPQIVNRVSLGHIASYLGISAETLSRIRR